MAILNLITWGSILRRTILTKNEDLAIYYLEGLLNDLNAHTRNFETAVKLYDFWESHGKQVLFSPAATAGWGNIAGRDAVMTVFHFGDTIDSIKALIRSHFPTLKESLDWKAIKRIHGSFVAAFPDHVHLRDAVAHIAEQAKNPDYARMNSFGHKQRERYMAGVGSGKFVTSHKGKVRSLPLNAASLAKLQTIRDRFFEQMKVAMPANRPPPKAPWQRGRG